MVSVERILNYGSLEAEGSEADREQIDPPSDWPTAGEIVMEDLKLRYGTDGPYVLNGITATIHAKEKVRLQVLLFFLKYFNY